MRSVDLLSSTAVRLAGTYAALFSLAVVATFAVLYWQVGRQLEGRLLEQLGEIRSGLELIDRRDGFNDLAGVVADEAVSVRDNDTVILLLGATGERVAGNALRAPFFSGTRWLAAGEIEGFSSGHSGGRFLATWLPVSGGRLLIGIADEDVRRTQSYLLEGLTWGLGSSVFVAFGLGAWLGLGARRRIERVGQTLTAVAQGRLEERVPLAGTGDDLDHIAVQINATLGRLQGLFESLRQSSADIAHDLKTPIFHLRQRLESARRLAGGDERVAGVLEEAIAETDGITATFESLLDITQIEAGVSKERFTPLDIAQVVAGVCEAYDAVAEDAGDRLSLVAAPGLPAVHGDRHLLARLLSNLIENAIRHGPAGTSIAVGLRPGQGKVLLSVADDGPGIPDAERERVFRRLYRLEKSRTSPGSGLGLALVKAICDLHGARIALADNRPGLRVEIAFPAA